MCAIDTIVSLLKVSKREAELLDEIVSLIDPNIYDALLYKLQNESLNYVNGYNNGCIHFYLI